MRKRKATHYLWCKGAALTRRLVVIAVLRLTLLLPLLLVHARKLRINITIPLLLLGTLLPIIPRLLLLLRRLLVVALVSRGVLALFLLGAGFLAAAPVLALLGGLGGLGFLGGWAGRGGR